MKLEMIKLVSGEVVIGEILEEETNDTMIGLRRPRTLMLDPMQGGVGMMPYDAIYTQEECEMHAFNRDHILHNLTVHPSFKDAYVEQVTGIETPTIELAE